MTKRGPGRHPADEERQQVQRARVGPVQVLHHERGPTFCAQGAEQVPDRREQPGPVGGRVRRAARLRPRALG